MLYLKIFITSTRKNKLTKTKFCQLWLTCESQEEADKIAAALLNKQLIVCAKSWPISCMYRWRGKIADGKEVLLLMESREDLFNTVEAEVKKLHSYETFVLQAIPMAKLSKEATKWMQKELR
jgi:periplasmic divalent cation tolerance protein